MQDIHGMSDIFIIFLPTALQGRNSRVAQTCLLNFLYCCHCSTSQYRMVLNFYFYFPCYTSVKSFLLQKKNKKQGISHLIQKPVGFNEDA